MGTKSSRLILIKKLLKQRQYTELKSDRHWQGNLELQDSRTSHACGLFVDDALSLCALLSNIRALPLQTLCSCRKLPTCNPEFVMPMRLAVADTLHLRRMSPFTLKSCTVGEQEFQLLHWYACEVAKPPGATINLPCHEHRSGMSTPTWHNRSGTDAPRIGNWSVILNLSI